MADQRTLEWAPPPRRARRRGAEILTLVGFLLCLLLGAAALATLWMVTRPSPLPSGTAADATLLQPQNVVVGLATRSLAGDEPAALISQALQAGELDTAAALLLFDTTAAPATRAALWQQLARRWLDAGDATRATLAYNRVLQLAVLDPALHSLGRSQLLVQATTGFAAAGRPEAATDAAWQAVRAIAQSPDLLPAQRSQLLQELRPAVIGAQAVIEDVLLAAEVDELLRNPYGSSGGVLVPATWNLLQAPLEPDAVTAAALAAAADHRRLMARNLADRDVLTSGSDVEPERQALNAALLAEDSLRAQTAQTLLAGATTLQQQIWVLQQEQQRHILRLQVARGAFGISLAPEWEANLGTIEAELAAATAALDRLVSALADAQSIPLEQNLLRAESAHWLALQSVLGAWPGGDPAQASERLRFAQDELQRLGSPLALPAAWDSAAAPLPGFRIQPRD